MFEAYIIDRLDIPANNPFLVKKPKHSKNRVFVSLSRPNGSQMQSLRKIQKQDNDKLVIIFDAYDKPDIVLGEY